MTDSPFIQDITTASFLDAVVTRSQDVPVLVDFWATWCGPCRALGPVLERLAKEYAGGFVLAKVDTDREQALAMQFQIRSIPTVMLFKGGKAVASFPGALPEGQIRAFLSQHGVMPGGRTETWSADAATRVTELRAATDADPSRTDLQLKLALALAESGMDVDARHALEALPASVYRDPAAVRARATLELRALAATRPDADAVRRGLEQVMAGERATGVDLLLEALRDDHSEESPARAALVAVLQMTDDEEFVRETRRRMAKVLF
jgi:putative thioredoxin